MLIKKIIGILSALAFVLAAGLTTAEAVEIQWFGQSALKLPTPGGKVLVLDEPPSMLTAQGVRDLRKVIERLKNEGIAVGFVTHKLIEAHTFGDRVTVLRRGRIVGEIPAEVFHIIPFAETRARIIEMLFGTSSVDEDLIDEAVGTARLQRRVSPDQAAPPILEINNISAQGGWMEPSLSEISFVIRPGEIFGIAGVDGNGQKQ